MTLAGHRWYMYPVYSSMYGDVLLIAENTALSCMQVMLFLYHWGKTE